MHKQELVQQFYKTFKNQSEIEIKNVGISCSGLKKKEISKRITISTIQTFINQVDNYMGCDLLVIDECHFVKIGTGSQYDKIIDAIRAKNPNMRLLGLSATPYRLDSGFIYGNRCAPGTINLFSKINHKITYNELREQEYLMPLEGQICTNEQLESDLNQIDKHGDYVLDQLGSMMSQSIHIDTAVQAIQQYADDYKCICVFACTIDHAEKLKAAINKKFPDKCTIIHSRLTPIERAANLQAWKSGRKRIITSVNILTNGFDYPPLDCLVMARPTESTGLFLQAIGRVLRIHPGKEKALLIDLTTNTDKFGTDLDNLKVIINQSAQEAGKKKNEKYCPECDEKVHIAIRICPECGFEWTQEENEKIIAKQMPEMKNIIFKQDKNKADQNGELFPSIPPTWYEVDDIDIKIHTSKQNGNKLGRIDCYYCPDESPYPNTFISVYFALSDFYDGYAVEMAHKRWAEFSSAMFPMNVDEFMSARDEGLIKTPYRIEIDHNDKFPKLLNLEFTKPEESEESEKIEFDDDIPF